MTESYVIAVLGDGIGPEVIVEPSVDAAKQTVSTDELATNVAIGATDRAALPQGLNYAELLLTQADKIDGRRPGWLPTLRPANRR